MAVPISEWIGRAPEIWASIKEKFAVLEGPLAAARQLQTALFGAPAASDISASSVVLPVMAFVTPAAGELLLFFGALIFLLAGQFELRAQLCFAVHRARCQAALPQDHERHRKNLTGYLAHGDDHQRRARRDRRARRIRARISQSGDRRRVGGPAELRALCRAGGDGRHSVRRRPGHVSLARSRVGGADRLCRAGHRRGQFHHADHHRSTASRSVRS